MRLVGQRHLEHTPEQETDVFEIKTTGTRSSVFTFSLISPSFGTLSAEERNIEELEEKEVQRFKWSNSNQQEEKIIKENKKLLFWFLFFTSVLPHGNPIKFHKRII